MLFLSKPESLRQCPMVCQTEQDYTSFTSFNLKFLLIPEMTLFSDSLILHLHTEIYKTEISYILDSYVIFYVNITKTFVRKKLDNLRAT